MSSATRTEIAFARGAPADWHTVMDANVVLCGELDLVSAR